MQHLLCTVCSSLHRHHSGIMFTGIRFYQCTIYKATHNVRNQAVQHRLHRRMKGHSFTVSFQIFLCILFSLQRKQLKHIRFHLECIDHFGINNINLIQFLTYIFINQMQTDVTRPVKGRILHGITEFSVNIYIFFHEILSSKLTNHKQFVLSALFQLLRCKLQNVVVISSCQTLVSSNHQIATFLLIFRNISSEKDIVCVWNRLHKTCDSILLCKEKRFCVCQAFLCFLHL